MLCTAQAKARTQCKSAVHPSSERGCPCSRATNSSCCTGRQDWSPGGAPNVSAPTSAGRFPRPRPPRPRHHHQSPTDCRPPHPRHLPLPPRSASRPAAAAVLDTGALLQSHWCSRGTEPGASRAAPASSARCPCDRNGFDSTALIR